MISPFEVYVVMQLDTVKSAALGVASLTGFASIFLVGLAISSKIDAEAEWRTDASKAASAKLSETVGKLSRKVMATFALCVAATAFLPSTQTAAAMILVPALTSKEITEPVGAEAKELYNLLKRGLTKYVDDGQAPATTEKKAN